MNPYELARMAGCLQPDDEHSYGARWLDEIGWRAENIGPSFIENLGPTILIGTSDHETWKLYAELGGWQRNVVAQRITSGEDMTDVARRALYSIALKLAHAVAESSTTEGVA